MMKGLRENLNEGEPVRFLELIPERIKDELVNIFDEYLNEKATYNQVYEQARRLLVKNEIYRDVWKRISTGELAYFLEPQSSSRSWLLNLSRS